jgi:hypothetical protein
VGLILLAICFFNGREYWLAVIISSMWGPLFFFGIVTATGIRINVTICICITVFVGLAGDSAIQFLLSKDPKNTLTQSVLGLAPASALTFLFMGLSCLVFAFSDFAVTQQLAWLFPLGFLILYIGDVFVLQALIGKDKTH